MGKVRKKIKLHVDSSAQVIRAMEALERSGLEVEAEFRPGSLEVSVFGTKEELKNAESKLRGAFRQGLNKRGGNP
ncbi:MAG: hypothetical protein AB1305_02610 [Candidatus Hadarchaeota archaeon]